VLRPLWGSVRRTGEKSCSRLRSSHLNGKFAVNTVVSDGPVGWLRP